MCSKNELISFLELESETQTQFASLFGWDYIVLCHIQNEDKLAHYYFGLVVRWVAFEKKN